MTIILSVLMMAFTACDDKLGDSGSGLSAGDPEILAADGVSFVMVYVPGGKIFPTGADNAGTG